VIDVLDVADLESEQTHAYRVLPSTARDNRLFVSAMRADGGRSNRMREQFRLRFEGECSLVLRLHSDSAVALTLHVGKAPPIALEAHGDDPWIERTVRLSPEVCRGEQSVTLASDGAEPFSALHYWSISD
jgi:hypothetical protein